MTHLFHVFLVTIALALPTQAQFGGNPSTTATLHADVSTIAPASTFTVALKLDHPNGWHGYYRNSGGIELPPTINWTLPAGFSAGDIQWPTPEVKDGYFGKSFIYTGSPVFLVDITTPTNLETGSQVELKADAVWQICKESCINEDQSFTLRLATADQSVADRSNQALIETARSQLPASSDSWSTSASGDADSITIRFNPGTDFNQTPTDFIPDQAYAKSVSSGGEIKRDGEAIIIQLPRASVDALDEPIQKGNAISGILISNTTSALIPLTPISTAPTTAENTTTQSVTFFSLLPILGGMFLGGLILNLMPCVFPVIGLKIMGFVQQAGEDRKKIILHGVIFTLGVMASFAVLSSLLFIFKEKFGWGDQLGEPWFVMPMMILMFLLGLNMFGVFEIGTSATSVGGKLQSKQGLIGSFLSGTLATLIATPCSAPFLGAAIGAAIALPALQFFTAFGAMAIGLSTPYLILSAFPKLIDALPRPGAWMESFKQAMSFLLFATAGFLLWIYAGLIDLENLLGPIFGLSSIAIAGWIYGRWNLPHRNKRTRNIALILTLAFTIGGLYLAKPPGESALTWEKWSEEKVEELLEDGKPVYIDFTAQWCATCQVNKKRAYTAEVIKQFDKKGVVTLKADKTKPNPAIEAAIRSYGRAAIPVNVLLAPGKDPVILPELLSPNDVIKALNGL